MAILVSLFFSNRIPIDCKMTNFSLCVFKFFGLKRIVILVSSH